MAVKNTTGSPVSSGRVFARATMSCSCWEREWTAATTKPWRAPARFLGGVAAAAEGRVTVAVLSTRTVGCLVSQLLGREETVRGVWRRCGDHPRPYAGGARRRELGDLRRARSGSLDQA